MKPECTIGQGFGGNATETYKAGGLLGHPAIDSFCGYGTPIRAYFDGYVYKVLTKENPANDGSGFTGVFVIVENEEGLFEFLYGHCDPQVKVGDHIKKGDIIGTEANNGEVYSGSGFKSSDFTRITLAMQKAGDRRGSHRHDQMRVIRRYKNLLPSTQYLTDAYGFYYDGNYYGVPYYNNGYNGCFDWTNKRYNVNLKMGDESYEVERVQRLLVRYKYMAEPKQYGYFGDITRKALFEFQKDHIAMSWYERYILRGLLFGLKTRDICNSLI